VYIVTLAYVTSILPSRFDEICAIVGAIGCALCHDPNARAALSLSLTGLGRQKHADRLLWLLYVRCA
jgi:hypothetical protein